LDIVPSLHGAINTKPIAKEEMQLQTLSTHAGFLCVHCHNLLLAPIISILFLDGPIFHLRLQPHDVTCMCPLTFLYKCMYARTSCRRNMHSLSLHAHFPSFLLVRADGRAAWYRVVGGSSAHQLLNGTHLLRRAQFARPSNPTKLRFYRQSNN
jgi:hypothetical protein